MAGSKQGMRSKFLQNLKRKTLLARPWCTLEHVTTDFREMCYRDMDQK